MLCGAQNTIKQPPSLLFWCNIAETFPAINSYSIRIYIRAFETLCYVHYDPHFLSLQCITSYLNARQFWKCFITVAGAVYISRARIGIFNEEHSCRHTCLCQCCSRTERVVNSCYILYTETTKNKFCRHPHAQEQHIIVTQHCFEKRVRMFFNFRRWIAHSLAGSDLLRNAQTVVTPRVTLETRLSQQRKYCVAIPP